MGVLGNPRVLSLSIKYTDACCRNQCLRQTEAPTISKGPQPPPYVLDGASTLGKCFFSAMCSHQNHITSLLFF